MHLQTGSITASKSISEFTQSRLPGVSPNSLDHGLKVRTLMASQVARLRSRIASLSSLNLRLQVHVQTRSMTASKYISKFTQSQCDETVELSRHRKGICENEWLWLKERTKRVGGYEGVLSCEERNRMCGSMNARQDCAQPSTGKDSLGFSCNEMMSIKSGVSPMSTPHCSVHLCYPSVSVCPMLASPTQTEWQWW